MAYFSERDRALIESLVFDPTAKPSFELLKGCLIWQDERPDNLTPDGYDRLCDLWIARASLHRGLPVGSLLLTPERFAHAWHEAQRDGVQWPGFRRVMLSAEDRAYYDQALEELETATEY